MVARSTLFHTAYLITIIIKGLFGLLEFCGGAMIAIFGPQQLHGLVLRVIDPQLYQRGSTLPNLRSTVPRRWPIRRVIS